MVAAGVAATCAVNAFSIQADLVRHGGQAFPFWKPLLWEFSSGAMIVGLLPFVRQGVVFSLTAGRRLVFRLFLHAVFAIGFSAIHVLGMVALRKLAYGLMNAGPYAFEFTAVNLFYEFRKDLVAYFLIAGVFWLAGRSNAAGNDHSQDTAQPPGAEHELWLRDGATSIRVNPPDIVWVASAGNYVEYCLADGQRHLIRSTLAAEEKRLASFGLVRVHRTRLVQPKRITRFTALASGGFEVELDSGEVVVGSRRYRERWNDLPAS